MACEPIVSIVFSKDKLFEISRKSTEIENLGRICLRQFATKQEDFYVIFKLYTAKERFEYIETITRIFYKEFHFLNYLHFLV